MTKVRRSAYIGTVTMEDLLSWMTATVGHDTADQLLCSSAIANSGGKSVYRPASPGSANVS